MYIHAVFLSNITLKIKYKPVLNFKVKYNRTVRRQSFFRGRYFTMKISAFMQISNNKKMQALGYEEEGVPPPSPAPPPLLLPSPLSAKR